MIVPGLSQEELVELEELQQVHALISMPGWKTRIQPLMQAQVEDAHENMVGNLSNDPMTYMRLQLRWQQREAMLRAVLGYIDECEQRRTRILEEIKEREKLAAGDSSGVPIEEYA